MTQDDEHLRLVSIFHYTVAGMACMFMPFGTVLGVCTVIVLSKESAKEWFQASSLTLAQSRGLQDS